MKNSLADTARRAVASAAFQEWMENRRHLLRLPPFPERTERWLLMRCGINRLDDLDADPRAAGVFSKIIADFKAGDRTIHEA